MMNAPIPATAILAPCTQGLRCPDLAMIGPTANNMSMRITKLMYAAVFMLSGPRIKKGDNLARPDMIGAERFTAAYK